MNAGRSRFASHRLVSSTVSTVALLLCLVLVELVLRAARPGLIDVPSRHRISDPRLGWILRPGDQYEHRVDSEKVRVHINEAGWRDRARSVERPVGTLRVGVLGDSFVESYSVNLEEAFQTLLAESLTAVLESEVEVLSFGVGGYGTLQELMVYRDVVRAHRPQLVLLGFCVANDVRNNSHELESLLAGSALAAPGRPFLVQAPSEGTPGLSIPEPWLIDRSAAARAHTEDSHASLRQVFRRSVLAKSIRRALTRATGPSAEDVELAVHGVHFCEEPAVYRRAWEITEILLRRIREEVRTDGAKLLVFSEPTYRETHPAARRSIETASSNPGRLCLDRAPGFERLGALLDELGVPFVDLLPAFRRLVETRSIFRRSDRHWSPAGHRLVADVLHRALLEHGLQGVGTVATETEETE